MNVIKRNGQSEPYSADKIKAVIDWAVEDIDINRLELESKLDINIKDNITTPELQQILINTALSLCTAQKPAWRFVAARLKLMGIYKECELNTPDNYVDFLNEAIDYNIYDPILREKYSFTDLTFVESHIDNSRDLGFDYAGINLLENRYLMRKDNKLYEKPQHMFMTLALMLAIPEHDDRRVDIALKYYDLLSERKLSLATPLLLNLRRPGGNLASCFITKMNDSLDSIYDKLNQCAQISKNAGGVGVNLSSVRAKGATIKHVANASGGVVPWIKLINDTAVAVNQLGSRSGAITVALDSWHLDIFDFLELQTENGDFRTKAHDVFPQVVVSDLFMQRVESNENWTLFDPHEIRKLYDVDIALLYGAEFELLYKELETDKRIKLRKVVSAKHLFKEILKTVVETGMPYIFFKDATNESNPNKHAGMIGNANLCTESFSNFDGERYVHTCNLLSLNLAVVEDSELEVVSSMAVRMLDNAIDLTEAPIAQSNRHNNDYRILGIGLMGFADYLVKHELNYSNCHDKTHWLMSTIKDACVITSEVLGEDRGNYDKFDGSKWSETQSHMRNGGLLAIAPTTSTSLLMGATASILPPYSKFYIDKASNGAVPICPPLLNADTFFRYKENKHIDQTHIIDVVSIMQKYVDQGISMELLINMQNGFSAKDLYDLYIKAWKEDLKTVYYVRSITGEQKVEDCVSCSG